MRIAFFGPVNPTPSGISDYDEELLPLLRELDEIDVFVDGKAEGKGVYSHAEFYQRNRNSPYDLNLYQLGNSLVHEYMYGYMFHYPGAIVFHDSCLHHSRAKMLLQKGFIKEYFEEAALVHPGEHKLGDIVYEGAAGELLLYYFPFVRLLLESALAAGAHTDPIVKELGITETPVIKIPMAVQIDKTLWNADASNLYPGKTVIASFGLATPEKRIDTVLQAVAELRCYYPNLRYLIVGEVAKHYDLHQEIADWEVQDVVEVTGGVDHDRFHSLLADADIVVNLRYPSAGEMSATLLRAMAYGKPVLMSRLDHLQEIPEDAVIRVRPDHEIDDLFHHLWQLVENETLRKRFGNRAKAYIEKEHRPEQMADAYRKLMDAALQRKPSFRPPQLPLHLQSSEHILRDYIRRTSFSGKETDLIDWIL